MIVPCQEAAPVPVVDVHVHLGPLPPDAEPDGRLEALLRAMDAAGVDRACVFPSAGRGSDYPRETERILQASEASDGRIIAFARVHPFWREEAVSALRAAAERGVRGLKLHPFMDGGFMANDPELVHPLLRVASEFGLVVLVHSGWGWNSAPGVVADLARTFPDVSIVMGHSGRFGFHREAAAVGADVPNLFFDLAGLSIPRAIEELAQAVGPERLVFGSDHPYSPIGFELEKLVRWVRLPWHSLALIAGGNATRLLQLPSTGAGPVVVVPRAPVPSVLSEGAR